MVQVIWRELRNIRGRVDSLTEKANRLGKKYDKGEG